MMYPKYSALGTDNLHLLIFHLSTDDGGRFITSLAFDEFSLNETRVKMSKSST